MSEEVKNTDYVLEVENLHTCYPCFPQPFLRKTKCNLVKIAECGIISVN